MDKYETFITEVAKYAIAETSTREKWILPSVCIAQAILESGWNIKCTTLFGIKSNDVNNSGVHITSEYVNGKWIIVKDRFVEHKNIADSVHYYYDFIASTPRYANCLNNVNYEEVTHNLIHTLDGLPYATAPGYERVLNELIENHELTKYDFFVASKEKFNIGDVVRFDYIFYTSEDEIPLVPAKFEGVITEIREGARNPYLINNGLIGWCNDMYMSLVRTTEFNVDDDVIVINPIDVNNNKIKLYYDYYKIIEVGDNDVVIGVDGIVTCRIKKEYIRKV